MTKLIVLIVIILGVIAIAQLVRMYELSSKLRNRREEDIPNRDNRLNATLLLVFMFFISLPMFLKSLLNSVLKFCQSVLLFS